MIGPNVLQKPLDLRCFGRSPHPSWESMPVEDDITYSSKLQNSILYINTQVKATYSRRFGIGKINHKEILPGTLYALINVKSHINKLSAIT